MTTYTLIDSYTVGVGGASSVTLGSGGTIPQTYTDLKMVMSVRNTTGLDHLQIAFNGSTSTYTLKSLRGNGAAAQSFINSDYGISTGLEAGYDSNGTSIFTNGEIYVPNYTSSNQKSVSMDIVQEANATTAYMVLNAGLWSGTSAITSMTISPQSYSFAQYSTFYLYGVKSSAGVTYQYNSIPSTLNVGDVIQVPYTGSAQTLVLPSNVKSVNITVAGARGGASSSGTNYGKGAFVSGSYTFGTGVSRTIYAYVGGNGTDLVSTGPSNNQVAGGFNGGGYGWYANYSGAEGYAGAGGGGATDIRVGGTALSNRIIVGGGGGGDNGGGVGGDAGYATGNQGTPSSLGTFNGQGGFGGTQSAGGAAGATNNNGYAGTNPTAGSLGNGGNGGNPASYGCGSGGGGGYYGGGGGGGHYNGSGGGGGGGSSYYDSSMTNISTGTWFGSAYAQITVTSLGS